MIFNALSNFFRSYVRGSFPVATLTGPDEDGDYGWTCTCGARSESVQPIADAIAHAEVHVDLTCVASAL